MRETIFKIRELKNINVKLKHFVNGDADANANAGGSAIALSGFCPGELINDSAVAHCIGIRMGLVLTGHNTLGTGPFCE